MIMKNLISYRYLGLLAAVGLVACSSSYSAMQGETDDMYYMASDDAAVTAYAVDNNTPNNFERYANVQDSEDYSQDNFSAKNVNPEYIAKYQVRKDTVDDDEVVYFDDSIDTSAKKSGEGDVNVYNNFYGYDSPRGQSNWNMNPWMFNSMNMMGFYPGFGMGGFYDPFWGPGFRPGFSMSIGMGFGFGNPWAFRPFGMRGFYGMGGFYDPFWDPFWGNRFYGSGFGYGGLYGGYGYGRPIIVNNIYTEGGRQLVRAARTSRGSAIGTRSRDSQVVRSATASNSRTVARRSAISRVSGDARSRTTSDFSRSENDYYNSRTSAAPTSRSVNSAAMTRPSSSSSSRSAYTVPNNTRTRTNAATRSTENSRRYTAPSNTRSTSPSYNRSTSPNRSSNYSTPTRTRSTDYTPSRSSGTSRSSSVSTGGSSRSSGTSTRSSGGSRRGGN